MDIHRVNDLLQEALQSDLEHGVKWLNERASREFHVKYPNLAEAIRIISNAEYDEENT